MTRRTGYIIRAGTIDYGRAWDLQHQLWERRVAGDLPDVVLLLEHPHVITLGRRGGRSHLKVSEGALTAMKIPLFHVERGGEVTYHGPGQAVVYPIISLKDYGYRVVRYVEQMEEVILRVLRDFGIEGRRDPLNRGVWVDAEKIASVGVAIKRSVSLHGFALNYATDLGYFDLMDPCGLVDRKMTTMEKVLGERIPKDLLSERIVLHFREIFPGEWKEEELEKILPPEPDRSRGGTDLQTPPGEDPQQEESVSGPQARRGVS